MALPVVRVQSPLGADCQRNIMFFYLSIFFYHVFHVSPPLNTGTLFCRWRLPFSNALRNNNLREML